MRTPASVGGVTPSPLIRPALAADAATILRFIRELAEFEKEPDAVEVTEDVLRAQLEAVAPPFECVLAEVADAPVGFALFFPTYSTWRGKAGMWLEDLYVTPDARGHGVGRALLSHLAGICVDRGYARFEWSVLDWNVDAIAFYRSVGAVPQDEWTRQRLTGEALRRLARR